MMADAGSVADEETQAILRADGDEAARAWRCPRVCRSSEPLDADHVEALGAVQALTGHKFKGCPLSAAWAPWVHRVVEADEHGIADDRAAYGPPPRALVEAVRVIRRARKQRDAEEARVAKEERNRE